MNKVKEKIKEHNYCYRRELEDLKEAFNSLFPIKKEKLRKIKKKLKEFQLSLPSWALCAGGTRFYRFPFPGEPRNIWEKLEDCALVKLLSGIAKSVSLHYPWDKVENPRELRDFMNSLGLRPEAMNSNTFQDQPGQKFSYKFGSLSNPDKRVREQAIEHNLEVVEFGKKLGSKGLVVWIGDGSNYPGQMHFRRSFEHYLRSLERIYKGIPEDWRLYLEYKPFEPAFYYTVNADWGTSYIATEYLGNKAFCLVDLGHHLPNTNIEAIVARLISVGKLGGFHFNDSKYGDDDLTTGSIAPYRLFLIFNEIVDAQFDRAVKKLSLAYLIDQSHNIKDPVEALLQSCDEIFKAYARALLVEREELWDAQKRCDAISAELVLKRAFEAPVDVLVKETRVELGGAFAPVALYRELGYRNELIRKRSQ